MTWKTVFEKKHKPYDTFIDPAIHNRAYRSYRWRASFMGRFFDSLMRGFRKYPEHTVLEDGSVTLTISSGGCSGVNNAFTKHNYGEKTCVHDVRLNDHCPECENN